MLSSLLAGIALGYILLEWVYQDTLFRANLPVVMEMQSMLWDNELFKRSMLFMTKVGYGAPIYVLLLLEMFARQNQLAVMTRLLYILTVLYLLTNMKQLYGAVRPYMLHPDIKQMGCEQEYGSPSGHA